MFLNTGMISSFANAEKLRLTVGRIICGVRTPIALTTTKSYLFVYQKKNNNHDTDKLKDTIYIYF